MSEGYLMSEEGSHEKSEPVAGVARLEQQGRAGVTRLEKQCVIKNEKKRVDYGIRSASATVAVHLTS
eukprot:m.41503 g.41503  ORF g.41503 m.41503 type:complete len:67 (+) comp8221_c0_seq1:117-317(+)